MSVRLKISVFGLLLFLCSMPVARAAVIVDGTPTPTEIDPTWVAASGSVVYVEADPSWVAASGSVVYVEADPTWVAASGSVVYVEADPTWVAASGSVIYAELDPSWTSASGGVRYTTGLIATNDMNAIADAAYRGGGASGGQRNYARATFDAAQNINPSTDVNPFDLTVAAYDAHGIINLSTDWIELGLLPDFNTNKLYGIFMNLRTSNQTDGYRQHCEPLVRSGLYLSVGNYGWVQMHAVGTKYAFHTVLGFFTGTSTNFALGMKIDVVDTSSVVDMSAGTYITVWEASP